MATLAAQPQAAPVMPQKVMLNPEHELRVEIELGKSIKLTLVDGTAEWFGTELAKDHEYTFSGVNGAVFTWHGCVLQIEGTCHSYIANDTPNAFYLNTHFLLQQHRENAKKTGGMGPRVMVLGATDSGKSSLCRILVNLATRLGEEVTLVDLDIGQGAITVPTMLSAAALNRPFDVSEVFNPDYPLVYFFGGLSPSDNIKLYTKQINQLAATLQTRFKRSATARTGGMIVNTCGWVDNEGFALQLQSIEIFQPDYIFVIAHERVYSDLQAHYAGSRSIQVVKFPKSGGVVTRDRIYRKKSRFNKARDYFYGAKNELSPQNVQLNFSDVLIYRAGSSYTAPLTALPIGAEAPDPTKLTLVTPSPDLVHSILGLSFVDSVDKLYETPLAGYGCVVDVNVERRKLTLMVPQAGVLPGKLMLLGSLKYQE